MNKNGNTGRCGNFVHGGVWVHSVVMRKCRTVQRRHACILSDVRVTICRCAWDRRAATVFRRSP